MASSSLPTSLQGLRQLRVIPDCGNVLEARASALTRSVLESILEQVPAFTASGNPDVIPELKAHLHDHASEVCRLLSGQQPGEFSFVRHHARQRANQKFPLDAELAAYRGLHRGFASAIRDAATQAADDSAQLRRVVAAAGDFVNQYAGEITNIITSEYVLQTRVLAEAEGDRRSELLNILLRGYDESDSRAAQLLRRAGYLEHRQSYCVAVARSVDPKEMENTARAQRMVDALSHAIRNLPYRALIGISDAQVMLILSGTRRLSGWTAPQSLLADRVYPALRTVGTAALIGVSTDKPSTAHIPRALSEARFALDCASVGNRVVSYSGIPFRDVLVRAAADQVRSTLPEWIGAFNAADARARGALSETLRAYADADMNAQRTAKALTLHPNTIYARMQKIDDITARNPLSYNALTELLLAIDCAEIRF
ncbi:MAG: helix-turn-helix domain-containing protein [Gammaproteobacteria bacterium]|nr:helix-turn-helix domain-containing protein [Gammaproteobacteria bacterium]